MTYTKNYGNRYSINWYVVEWAVGLSNVIHMQGNLLNQFNLLSVKKLKINAVFCLLYDTLLFWWEGEDTRTHTHTHGVPMVGSIGSRMPAHGKGHARV